MRIARPGGCVWDPGEAHDGASIAELRSTTHACQIHAALWAFHPTALFLGHGCSLHAWAQAWAGLPRRHLGSGVTSLLTDMDKLTTLIAGLSVLALGIYTAREGTRVGGRAIDRRGMPPPPACPPRVSFKMPG